MTETLVQPPGRWRAIDLGELWARRELLYFLTWRDIKVRYKQTAIGAAWAVLQPLLTMIVFSIIFGNLLNVPSDGIAYPAFAYAGLLPWMFFSAAITRAANSLIYDAEIVSKVYFPRLLLPLAATLAPAVDFAIASVLLLVLLPIFGIVPGLALLTLPLFLLLALATALAFGVWLAALNVRYRDVGYAVPFLVQFWLFITPVAYPTSVIPEAWRPLYGLNPMSTVVDGVRWAVLGADPPTATLPLSLVVVAIVLVSGLLYFARTEALFADVI
jgi:lipopolysaccharide transport system permease protein